MAVNLSPVGGAAVQFFNNDGVPLSGGLLYSYQAGTTTPQTTYTTAAGTIAHSNPIVLDSSGRVPGGEIWLSVNQSYKFVLKDSSSNLLGTYDNITGINGTGITSNASTVEYDPPFTGSVATTVAAKLGQYLSVCDFGAVGNDIHNDTTAIQAALDYCFNTGGGVVYVPPGNWKTTSPLIVRSNTSLIGSGPGTVIHGTGGSGSPSANVVHLGYGYEWNQYGQYFNPLSNNDATLAQLLVYDYSKITTSNVRVSNMTIKSSSNGLGVWTMNCQNAQIDNLWFIDTLTPVNVANDAYGWQCASHNVNVSDIWQISAKGVNDWYDIGFCGSATNVVFTRCYNNPNTPSALDTIVGVNQTHDMVMTNCVFSMETPTGKKGITYAGASTSTVHNTMVSDCIFKHLDNGVVFYDIAKGVCTSNTFDSCTQAIGLLAKSCLIENNMFVNNTTDISGNGDATGHVIQGNYLTTISNNDIDFEAYNTFRDNTNGAYPTANTNSYGPLYERQTTVVPYEGFVNVTQIANVTDKSEQFFVTAGATVSLLYKIPQNFKKIKYVSTTGYAAAAGEVITISIVGNNGAGNSSGFPYTQSVATLTTAGAGDFGVGASVVTPALYSQGGYYIKITVTFANTGSRLRQCTMIGLSDC
jgi:Pectate lyase superfamily protein